MAAPLVPVTDWEIRDEILIGEEVGRGSYGRVCEGEWKGAKVAVKMVHDIFVEVGLPKSDVTAFMKKFEAEWETMKSLRHPNVMQLFGVSNPKGKQPKMIMELMDESLEHRLTEGPPLSASRKLHILKSIACGLLYLHELPRPVIHRDLASKNVLVSRDAVRVKIGDLGVAKFLSELHCGRGTVMPGTELYMPPEARSELLPHPSLDIFSFGVIMVETIVSRLPSPLPLLKLDPKDSTKFCVLTELERRAKDVKEVPKDHPLNSVIFAALDVAEKRPSAAQILESLSDFKEKIRPNAVDVEDHSAELQACKQKANELEADKERVETENTQLKAEIVQLREKNAQLLSQTDNRQLKAEIVQLRENNEQLLLQADTLKTQNALLCRQIGDISNALQRPVDQPDARDPSVAAQIPAPISTHSPAEFTQLPLVVPSPAEVHGHPILHMVRSERVSVDSSLIKYVETPDNDVGGFLSLDHPIGDNFSYFEVRIVNSGACGTIGIGLAGRNYHLSRQPGWDCGSVAYHCDDGMLFSGSGYGEDFHEPSQQGDIIGCGIKKITQSQPDQAAVFFTRNGIVLGQKIVSIPDDGLYPMVGLHSQGEVVQVNFEAMWGDQAMQSSERSLESNLDMRYKNVALNGDTVSYFSNQANDVGVYQALSHPMDTDFTYFEVRIVNYGFRGTIGIGLARYDYPLHRQPGWETDSVAYHCDDGKLYVESGQGQQFHSPAVEGDVIGCGISLLSGGTEQQATVFFSRNGAKLGEIAVAVPLGGLYPTVGLHSVGEVVQINLTAFWSDVSTISPCQTAPLVLNVPPEDTTESDTSLTVVPPPYFSLFPSAVCEDRYERVQVKGNRITYVGNPSNDVGAFQSLGHRFGSNFTYYEVQVVNYGTSGMIGVGLARRDYPLDRQPGWNTGSVAYHCDDGKLFCENGFGQPFHFPAQQGDVVGCGVSKVIPSDPNKAVVFFTRNGRKLGEITVLVPEGGFYPMVGLHSAGEVVEVNFEVTWNDDGPPQAGNVRHERVHVEGDKITYVENHANAVGVFQLAGRPMNISFSYYEVTVVNFGSKGTIAVGLASCEYPLNRQPGWNKGSVAYHCDDGKLYKESGSGLSFHEPARQGDIIGCGIRSVGESNRKADVFFTRNGRMIGEVTIDMPRGGLCPTIGLHSAGEVVKINANAAWDETAVTSSLPSLLSGRHERVEVTGDTIRYVGNLRNDVGAFQAINHPMRPGQSYYEVRILDVGAKGTIGIGIAGRSYPLNQQPGWFRGSVAYHCDDGRLFKGSTSGERFQIAAKQGDLVGCGIRHFTDSLPQQATVFFTRNGTKIGETAIAVPIGGFYPTVGLHSRGEIVQINVAAQWQANEVHRSEHVRIDGDVISYVRNRKGEIACFQALGKSMNDPGSYYEVEVVNYGNHGYIGIGLAQPDYPLYQMPGWNRGSIAYHCDDGKLFQEKGVGRDFHSCARQGDVIGCGVSKIIKSQPKTVELFFTKNGMMMGQVAAAVPGEGFFPIVGFHSEKASVKVSLVPSRRAHAPPPEFRSERIHVQGNRLSYAGNNTDPIGAYQLISRQLDSQFSYFQMKIMSSGVDGPSAIGLAGKGYPLNSMPGWENDSVAFHGDDGQLFCGVGRGQPFNSPAREGDVLGCGLDASHGRPEIFFTRNGTKMGQFPVSIPDGGFYPAIGMHSEGEAVDVNFSVNWLGDTAVSSGHSPSLRLHSERVLVHGDQVSYVGDAITSVGGVQVLSHPISSSFNYYKVHVTNGGQRSTIGVGLAHRGYPLTNQPGWCPGSIAYHCDDGMLYSGSGHGQRFHAASKAGDVIGCGVDFAKSDRHGKWVTVFFTRNGIVMGQFKVTVPQGGFYPTVGLHSHGEIIRLIM